MRPSQQMQNLQTPGSQQQHLAVERLGAGAQRDSGPGMARRRAPSRGTENLHGWCLFGSMISKLGSVHGEWSLGEGQVQLPIHPCR